jgi:signal peptidase
VSSRTGIRTTAAGLALAAVGCAWLVLAPAPLGGGTSYALVVGSSMEPGLHRGDLAIVRRRDAYRTGDVVLFRDRVLGRDVLHRVVARDRGRFVTKGDNNGYLDDYRPAPGDVHGALWLDVPAAGRPLAWLRVPSHAALLVALTALLALAVGTGAGAAVRGRRPRLARPAVARETLTAGALGVAGALAFVAVLAWTRPAERAAPEHAYAQDAELSYRAAAAPSEVYPDGAADTGEPVFVRLARRVDVSLAWRLEAAAARDVAGTAALEAVVSDGHGWERRVPLARSRRFAGAGVTLTGRLDLDRLRSELERVDGLTGAGTTTWAVAVRPAIRARASVAGRPVELAYEEPVRFTLDGVRLQPDGGESGAVSFARRVDGTLPHAAPAPFALGLDVGGARLLSLLGVAAALAAAGWARAGSSRRSPDADEALAARLGAALVESSSVAPAAARVVELRDAAGLVAVAEATGGLVVHARTRLGHDYALEHGGTLYRLRTGAPTEPDVVLRAVAGR